MSGGNNKSLIDHEIEGHALVQKVYKYFVHGFASNRNPIACTRAIIALENREDLEIQWGPLTSGAGFLLLVVFHDNYVIYPTHYKCRDNRVEFLRELEAMTWAEILQLWLSFLHADSFIRGFLTCAERPLNDGI